MSAYRHPCNRFCRWTQYNELCRLQRFTRSSRSKTIKRITCRRIVGHRGTHRPRNRPADALCHECIHQARDIRETDDGDSTRFQYGEIQVCHSIVTTAPTTSAKNQIRLGIAPCRFQIPCTLRTVFRICPHAWRNLYSIPCANKRIRHLDNSILRWQRCRRHDIDTTDVRRKYVRQIKGR